LQKVKFPKFEFPKSTKVNAPKTTNLNTESGNKAPPDRNQLSAEIESTERILDNVNEKIENQREKLADLKESYNKAFDGARKTKYKNKC
jgi:hypothetical protein